MLERGTHHLQLVLNVFQALASLLLDVAGHHLAFSRPFLLGRSARGIFKWVAPRLPGEKQNIHVTLCPEPSAPVHLFLMVVRPERAPLVLNFSLLREFECFRVGGHGVPRITVCYTCIEIHTLVHRGQFLNPAPLRPANTSLVCGYDTSDGRVARAANHGGFSLDSAPTYLVRDNDKAFGCTFIRRVRAMGIRDRPTSFRSPWQNAYVERLIGSIRCECTV